jgi:2-phospho-L-lactate guanylyltransferase
VTRERGAAVLVPVKAFSQAKFRLATALAPERRAALVRDMADRVLAAAQDLPVTVVCDDPEVEAWARHRGASVVWAPDQGLNAAVQLGVDHLRREGFRHVVIAHADLPLATDVSWMADFDGITLVPDRRRDGTNVMCVPADSGFRFAYGPGSFARHLSEAGRLEIPLRVVREPLLAWDVDVPEDLEFSSTVTSRR